jgi:hypothetical protein
MVLRGQPESWLHVTRELKELAMMASAKGYRELIADLASERPSLHESEMTRI